MFFLSKFLTLFFCGVYMAFCCVGVGVYAETSVQISRLLMEKQQKVQKLEQCAKKVKGFKIAGVSTIGLTALGVGGNVMLASKNKTVKTQIKSTQTQIEKKQAELDNINEKIAVAEKEQVRKKQDAQEELNRLNNCPGNLYVSVEQICPNCAAALDRKEVCYYNVSADDWVKKSDAGTVVFSITDGEGTQRDISVKCACDSIQDVIVSNDSQESDDEALGNEEKDDDKGDEESKEDKGNEEDKKSKEDKENKEQKENKGKKDAEKAVGVLKSECQDTEKHISEGVYEEFASGALSCYKTEKDTSVVKCRCKAKECNSKKYELISGECKEKYIIGKLGDMCKPAKNAKAQLIYHYMSVEAGEEYDFLADGNYVKTSGKNWCDDGDTLCECFSTSECMSGYVYDEETNGCKDETTGFDAGFIKETGKVNSEAVGFNPGLGIVKKSPVLKKGGGQTNSMGLSLF